MENRCYNCKFFAKVDSGYSNYTVTETTIHCLKKHFKPTEESYSWVDHHDSTKDHEFFKRAITCEDFKHETGIQIELDVDGTITIEDFSDDEEVYDAAKEYDL